MCKIFYCTHKHVKMQILCKKNKQTNQNRHMIVAHTCVYKNGMGRKITDKLRQICDTSNWNDIFTCHVMSTL